MLDRLRKDFKLATLNDYVVARNKSKRNMFLTPYTAEQLAEMGAKTYLTDDGVGFALKSDGDLIGVFNNSGRKNAGVEAMVLAIAEGAKTLDCIDSWLTDYYQHFGFVEKERMVWDDKQAPTGWEYSTGGRPDIIFFEYPDNLGRDPLDVTRRYELARDGQTSRGTNDTGVDSAKRAENGKRTRGRTILERTETPPSATGTTTDFLDSQGRPKKGGSDIM